MKGNIRFINHNRTKFFSTVRARVQQYFEENKIDQTGDPRMVSKAMLVFSMYLVPYFLILSGALPLWGMLLACIAMGIGAAGIGFGVMHDANHGSLSKSNRINRLLGYSLNFIGGNSFCWKIQHNVLHHTYTNIYEHDEDLNAGHLIRFSPSAKKRRFHKYQHLYALPLYGVMSLSWVLLADFTRLARYNKLGLTKQQGSSPTREFMILIASKIFYFSYILVIPYLVLGLPFWQILIGFLVMHFTLGIILSLVFQLAHIVEEVDQPKANEAGAIENEWAIHQLATTANFATNNKFIGWYTGGLNFQSEHHLFAKINHIHYPAISKIVKETAREFNVQYNEAPTMWQAFKSHMKLLYRLGREEEKLETRKAA